MTKGFINILSIALIYCGTVFGAGFASGQEIVTFFSSHALFGVATSFFVGFLFSFFGYAVCKKAKQCSLHNAKTYLDFLFPKGLSALLHLLCMSFLVVSFCIMIAGCGTLFSEQFSLTPVTGSLFSLVICYKIIKNRVNGLARFNAVVTPFMFFGVVALCCLVLTQAEVHTDFDWGNPDKAAFSGLLYLSYNMVSAVAVLAPCASIADSARQAGMGGILGGILIAVPLVLLSAVLQLFPDVYHQQLPFFALVCAIYPKLRFACGLLLYCAMLTTAASSGVSVMMRVDAANSKKSAILLCAAAFVVSFIPFDVLVKTMYTIFGVCGLILILAIIKSILRKQ